VRNKLVHRYWKVEDDEIREILGKLQVFRDFVEVLKGLEIKARAEGWEVKY
jgi:uncharacterized protein YutE (UPF0331/DUF86 family)